jgi:hypothetical protein
MGASLKSPEKAHFPSPLLTNRASVRIRMRRQIFPTSEFSALLVNNPLPRFDGNGQYSEGISLYRRERCRLARALNGLPVWLQGIDETLRGQRASIGEITRLVGCDVVCAEQRVDREGSSPSGARMRSVVSERGGNASRAGKRKQVWRSLNGHEGESWIQPRPTWSRSSQFPEGRVSIARWNPKGMRRSTGL